MVRTRLTLLEALLAAGGPAVFLVVAGARPMSMPAWLHFGLLACVAAVTCAASVALSLAGARARDGRSVLMGTAFSAMTALFTVHALATGLPGGHERRDRPRRRPVDPGRR